MPVTYEGRYALANPGEGLAALNINGNINVFGNKTYIYTTYSESFPDIMDEPKQKEKKKLDAQWWGNLLVGVGVTLLFAALTVCTAGVFAAACAGAAVAACAVTVAVSVADAKTGEGRSLAQFGTELIIGCTIGAVAGAAIWYLGGAALLETASVYAEGFAFQAEMMAGQALQFLGLPTIYANSVVAPVALGAAKIFMGATGVKLINDAAGWVTGENVLADFMFNGDMDKYGEFTLVWNLAFSAYLAAAQLGLSMMPRGYYSKNDTSGVPASEPNTGSTSQINSTNNSSTTESSASGTTNAGTTTPGTSSTAGGNQGVTINNSATTSEEEFERVMQQVEELDFSTKPNTAVVYSGEGNLELARQFVKDNEGMVLLENTPGGVTLTDMNLGGEGSLLTQEQVDLIWARASERYIQGASGTVVGFVEGARESSIYMQTELPLINDSTTITQFLTELFNQSFNP